MGLKKIANALRGARKIEWILLIAVAAVAVLLFMRDGSVILSSGGTELEARIESVLSMVDGAGRVRVLVNEEAVAQNAFASAENARTAAKGIVIVAEGAGDMRVSMELARAVKTLLGVELEQIEVLTMDGGK